MQPDQRLTVAAIGLDPIATPFGNARWVDDHTVFTLKMSLTEAPHEDLAVAERRVYYRRGSRRTGSGLDKSAVRTRQFCGSSNRTP
jgi:hypothetical protein